MDACTLEKPEERAEAEESGGKADARPSLSHTLYLSKAAKGQKNRVTRLRM